MLNYVALVWNPGDSAAGATAIHLQELLRSIARDLPLAFCSDGMIVLAAQPPDPAVRRYVLPSHCGVVLGTLFREPGEGFPEPTLCSSIHEKQALQMVSTGGRDLMENYWGSFVAFLVSSQNNRRYVIRDCSGWIPCFRTRHSNVEIIFSDLNDVAHLQLPPFTFNYRYLAASIYYPSLQIRSCGLTEVTELLAGDCLEIHHSGVRQYEIWDPANIVSQRSVPSYREAESLLRSTTQHCINAWAGMYDNILLRLSGGLDSSIVLACLTQASRLPQVACFNQCAAGSADDERKYARLAAARAGVPLIEMPWSESTFDAAVINTPKGPKPYPGDVYWWLEYRLFNDLTASTGAQAIWTGQGGDQIFLAGRDFPIASDYIMEQGLGVGALAAINDGARLTNKSYVSVLRAALRSNRSRRPWMRDNVRHTLGHFVNTEALTPDYQDYITNPWAARAIGLPAGKQAQIDSIADLLNRHKHLPRAERAYQRHPLQSRPLMELCLQIPTYVLAKGGRQRALARTAFSNIVPEKIIKRDDKGETSGRVRLMIRNNEEFLRGVLLDGVLVKERIVSRSALERIFVQGETWRPESYWSLLACISTEIWALTWQQAKFVKAAAA